MLIRSITGHRDKHPLAIDILSGEAGVIAHVAGIGQLRVNLEDAPDEIYIDAADFADWVRLYRYIGRNATVDTTQVDMKAEEALAVARAMADPEFEDVEE